MASVRLAFRIVPAFLVLGCGDAAGPAASIIGEAYRLTAIDGAAPPVRYYNSPDGTYYAIADSGSLTFLDDSMVRIATQRRVYITGNPIVQDSYSVERVHYHRDSTLVLIARSATTWDTASVYSRDAYVSFRHEGIPLGRWHYQR